MFQKGILERPSYMELSKKLGFTYNWIKDKKSTLDSHTPQKKTFNDLFNRLSARYKDLLKDSWTNIEIKFQNLYNVAFPTDTTLPSSTSQPTQSIKRKFFDDLKKIFLTYFPQARIFDTDLSRIFFNRARAIKDSHLKADYKFRNFTKSTLYNFIYQIRISTRGDFIQKIRDIKVINDQTLDEIKKKIELHIEKFIFSNPFEEKYVSDKHEIGTNYFKPEYDLTLNVWFNLSIIKKNPILLKHAQKILKYESFSRYNKGWEYSWDGLMSMLKTLTTLLPSKNYALIFEQVWNYVEQRNLYPALPRIYHPSWYALNTLKFHVIILLIRDLGLDILNLDPIEPESFKKNNIMESFTFERHHIFINDKLSIDVNRLVLVMHMNHNALEGKTDLVLDLIQSRIDLTFECPNQYKKNLKNWEEKWQEYLKRRTFLIEYGITNFIKEFFTDEHGNNYIFDRFFKDIPFYNIEHEINSMIQEWIEKNRPAPFLNTYVLNRLTNGTPKLLTSGYLKLKT
jgi:hypothetical protein